MFNKKSIVLSDTNSNSTKKAVLSLQEESNGVIGTLRLYNFDHELDGISSLGFYVDKAVLKAGLTLKSHMLYQFFLNLKQIPQNFSVAVVNFNNAVAKPILFGSSDGCDENIYGSIISDLSQQKATVKNAEKVLNEYGMDFDEEEKKDIQQEIDNALCEGNCQNCIYKKYFFDHQESKAESMNVNAEIASEKAEEIELPKEKPFENAVVFYNKLKPQIDKLFENNPIENNLQTMIPSSKWVKVEYEDDGDFYVFGLLYDEDNNVKFVCYGIPSVFEQEPPKELAGYPIWLPLDKENGFGYWLTYQDAITGQPIKAVLD